MISFEQEIKTLFNKYNIKYIDETNSTTLLDFGIKINNIIFRFDVKEKMQKYNMNNWTDKVKEEDCFILDELGIKKVMSSGIDSGIIVRDNLSKKYFFFNFLDLLCMPKLRVNRKISMYNDILKGKWIINLNNGLCCSTLQDVFYAIKKYENNKEKLFNQSVCYKKFCDEYVDIKGIVRTDKYKEVDYRSTR